MDEKAYRALDAVNWSKLKRMRLSPKHYAAGLTDDEAEDTAALALGRAVHVLTLEPDSYQERFVIWEGGIRRGKEWDAFDGANVGRTILTHEQNMRAAKMATAIMDCPAATEYLQREGGQAEHSITWTDPNTGLVLKARMDLHAPALVLDIKTARNAGEDRLFAADAFRLGYFHQLAYYVRGANAVYGGEHEAVIVAVEPAPPHDVTVYLPDADALYAVTEETDELLARLVECRESGKWPGRHTEPRMLALPRWAYPSAEDEMNATVIADVTKEW